jgi:subtilisin family serine protease
MSEFIQFIPAEDMEAQFVMAALSEVADWGLMATGILDAQKSTMGEGIVVAVLDTGYGGHVDLDENLFHPAIDCSGSATAEDHQGHGTHVAGIICAAKNDMGIIGVAPKAKFLPIKVLDDGGHGGYQAIADGIDQAVALGADIINMSLGAPQPPPDFVHDAIKRANAAGKIIVAAAGNDASAVNYPACFDEVIAVAAMDKDGSMARFSSRGAQVKAGAPGVGIYSCYLNNQYAVLSGTSQASPFIAGVCALILAHTRANPSEVQIKNSVDMLKALSLVTDKTGAFIGATGGAFGFGVPKFGNIDWNNV